LVNAEEIGCILLPGEFQRVRGLAVIWLGRKSGHPPELRLSAHNSDMKRNATDNIETLDNGLVTKKELAPVLRVSTRTLDNWQRKKILPYIKVGRLVRFNIARCIRALERFERREVK
jgi:excisionase family DNA binding protein